MDVTANKHTHVWVSADNLPASEQNDPEGYVYCAECLAPKPAPLPRPCVCGPAGIYAHEPFCTGPPGIPADLSG